MSPLSRRELLATGTGLVIAFNMPRSGRAAAMHPKAKTDPNAFVRIGPDDTVTLQIGHSEMGQGNWTGLAMLVAEELECDWSKMRVEHSPAAQAYAHLEFGTMAVGGSSTMRTEFGRYREVGAMARDMLVRAAAAQWKTSPHKLHTENGFVVHGSQKLSYGQLANAAMQLAPPNSVKLKKKSDWKYIGKQVRRLDTPEKTNGSAKFGMDVQFEGLRTALVARAPVFGAKVRSFDASKAKAVKGVEQVVQVPSGVAVIAKNFWSAKLGRDALQVEWEKSPEVDSAALWASYRELSKKPGDVAAKPAGDVDAALGSAATKVEAVYEAPYLAHATMEPLNCTVKIENGTCELWVGTQFQQIDQGAACAILGLTPDKVKVNTPFLGGGFGRRGSPRADIVSEAVHVAKAAGVPVKTVWTREDDMRGGYYRPAFLHRMEAGLDDKGNLIAWKHVAVGQSIMKGTMFEKMMVKDGIDPTSVEGAADSPYLEGLKARSVTLHTTENPVPVHFWRSVGNTHTAFAMEGMIDELAHAAGQDPLDFRLKLLTDQPRHAKVLKAAAQMGGWGTPLPPGRARGLAVHESFKTIVAQCAEVSVDPSDKTIRVHKVSAAIDCGMAVNPLAVEAQVQGSIVYGLTAALYGEITLKDGKVEQSNFHDYRMLRLPEMPVVQVQIIDSGEKMGGVGEPATPPIVPAVANAVFALTKQRLRTLPLKLA
jgi:isoquinoline 1-oxidoreductase beta subunit